MIRPLDKRFAPWEWRPIGGPPDVLRGSCRGCGVATTCGFAPRCVSQCHEGAAYRVSACVSFEGFGYASGVNHRKSSLGIWGTLVLVVASACTSSSSSSGDESQPDAAAGKNETKRDDSERDDTTSGRTDDPERSTTPRPPTGSSNPGPVNPPPSSCDGADGDATVSTPKLLATLSDRWHEAWLASPAVADLDGDGEAEILVAREGLLLGWHTDNSVVFRAETEGRIWAPPVVADLLPDVPGLEVAAAARGSVYLWDAQGRIQPGFPTTWRDELRSLAAADLDADGTLELVAVTTNKLSANGQADIIIAYELDGSVVDGFPPNTTGTSGCGEACYQHGGFDQNLALGDLDGDGAADIFAPQDNAYISLHHGNGVAFDADRMFRNRPKTNGVRFMLDLEEAKQGYADDEDTGLQAHFTNSAPAITDLDGDGHNDLVVLSSVQNAAQSDRQRGVALWAFRPDGTRLEGWSRPLHISAYLGGLWDFDGTNVVGATNQVALADITPESEGREIVFAGFDGQIHAVSASAKRLWSYRYSDDDRVLTGGVVIADLSADGSPEIVFNTYSPDADKGALVILDAGGNELHRLRLPDRGAMPVPTIADVDGDGTLEIVVSLKDGVDRERQVLVYSVASSKTNCMPWPTGRANLLRSGFVP